jgi:hypothetical protein
MTNESYLLLLLVFACGVALFFYLRHKRTMVCIASLYMDSASIVNPPGVTLVLDYIKNKTLGHLSHLEEPKDLYRELRRKQNEYYKRNLADLSLLMSDGMYRFVVEGEETFVIHVDYLIALFEKISAARAVEILTELQDARRLDV